MIPVRFHPEAGNEAEEAADWYEARQESLGQDFFAELDRAQTLLSESPYLWPLWPGVDESLGIRKFPLSRFPYGLAYEPSESESTVYAVAHLARRPGYWIDRLK